MGWYLRKSFRLAPGLRLNVSRRGIGLSAGTRGARVGIGPGGAYVHVGTGGIYYRKNLSAGGGRRGGRGRTAPRAAVPSPGRLQPGSPAGQGDVPPAAGRPPSPSGARPLAYPEGELPGGGSTGVLGCLGLVLALAALAYPWLWLAVAVVAGAGLARWRREGRLRAGWTRAWQAFRAGHHREALQVLEPLLARHPGEADLWLLWGLCLFHTGRVDDAAAALMVLDRYPESLGRLAAGSGARWEVEFQPWPIRIHLPSAPGVDLLQAYVLARAGRHGEALAQLDGVLALNPGFHPARFLKALILVDGAARPAPPEPEGAGKTGAAGAAPVPGAALREACDRAVALLQEIPRDDPLYLWAVAAMGRVFREAGQPDLAIAALRPATRYRRDAEALKAIRYELALAYEATGDRRRAREQLARIVTEDIGYRDARRLLEQWAPATGSNLPG